MKYQVKTGKALMETPVWMLYITDIGLLLRRLWQYHLEPVIKRKVRFLL